MTSLLFATGLLPLLAQALPIAPGPDVGPEPADPRADARPLPHRRPRVPAIDPAVLRALAAADPPVDALRAAATALAAAEPARARSLIDRAGLAGWLPELRVRVDRRFSRAESADLGSSAGAPLAPVGIDSNNDVRYECRATWDLGRIIFNPDELAAQFQALRTADARREVETLVIRLYFERRRLKAELAAADANDVAAGMRLEVRIAEIEAELDALTGGAFSKLARKNRDRDLAPAGAFGADR
jgi:hypothetical protein